MVFSWQSGHNRTVVLASDVVFMKALINTFFIRAVCSTDSGRSWRFGLALLINQKLRGINVFRTVFFMPVVISIVVVSICSGSSSTHPAMECSTISLGWLTFGLHSMPIDWLGNVELQRCLPSWPCQFGKASGFHMVIWLAGLQTISAQLFTKQATLRAPASGRAFRYITWPGLQKYSGADPHRYHNAGICALRSD